jgi:hypothetical protein
MKKHILLTITLAVIFGWAVDLVGDYILTRFSHPLAVIAVYAAALIFIGIPALLMLDKK